MEVIKSVNLERIVWCCEEFGISTEQLAAELGIPPKKMEAFNSGEDVFTFKQLRAIAEYFGRGILFFLDTTPIVDREIHSPQFRSLANQKPELGAKLRGLIERVEKHRDFYVEIRDELDASDYPRFNPPGASKDSPEDIAVKARAWLGLGLKNSFDTYRSAIESKGILVFRSNGYNGKWQIGKNSSVLGFSIFDPVCPVIVIKKLDSEPRQSFTLMHELGHLLVHRQSSIDDQGDFDSSHEQEQEANSFAGKILVPNDFLKTVSDSSRPSSVSEFNDWLSPFCKSWGVSAEVILRRLLENRRINRALYDEYRHWSSLQTRKQEEGGSRAFRHREPTHIFGDRYVRTVLDSLEARNITLARASTYLDSLKIKDLRQLERHYASI
jgi:Zn-dependent peptidase ImmA (M78 family)